MPVVEQSARYGWKGTAGGDVASPDWYYYWFTADPMPAAADDMAALDQLAMLESGLQASARYVPMVWCTSDVKRYGQGDPFPTPDQIGDLAGRFPGRVWLMFNEPDVNSPDAGCGGHIAADDRFKEAFADKNWTKIGNYIADQFALYYAAIKTNDPTARVFSMAPYRLPMPTLTGIPSQGAGGVELWNAFLGQLQTKGTSLDGIAIHAYPRTNVTGHVPGCNDDMQAGCTQEALLDAYRFFQGLDGTPSANHYASLTSNKPIWLTETGVLEQSGAYVGGQPLSLERVSSEYMVPMLQWFNAHITPSGNAPYINAVAWFVTYYDATPYTNLLAAPGSSDLTIVGETWRDAVCPDCECPGPDCDTGGR